METQILFRGDKITSCLLPIREAYEWKHNVGDKFGHVEVTHLLPIREAYEWKRCVGLIHELTLQFF